MINMINVMTEDKKNIDTLEVPSLGRLISRYLAFVGMFVGAGFISGGIVHLGEGFNVWDLSMLMVGLLFFVVSTCVQEFIFSKKNIKDVKIIQFILYSLAISIGVGMASGGTQHFVDTPVYSSYLIPIGLGIGMITFFLKEKVSFAPKKWLQIISTVIVMVIALILILGQIGKVLPESLLQDHGHDSQAH